MLGPSGNAQGGHKFLALNSECVVTRESWDILPMPNFVILRVIQLGSGQPSPLTFQDHLGNDVTDDVISPSSYSPPPINHDIPGVVDEPVKKLGVDLAEGPFQSK